MSRKNRRRATGAALVAARLCQGRAGGPSRPPPLPAVAVCPEGRLGIGALPREVAQALCRMCVLGSIPARTVQGRGCLVRSRFAFCLWRAVLCFLRHSRSVP